MYGKPTTAFRIGSMRHRITIQEFTDSTGSDGFPTKTWSTLWANVPTAFEQVSGGETRRGNQIEANATALFTMRFLDGVSPMSRITFDSKTYGIIRVNEIDGQTRYMEIQAARIANT